MANARMTPSRSSQYSHTRTDSGEYFPAQSYNSPYRPTSAMTGRDSRAPSATSTGTFRTANSPAHSRENSKQTPKMWARQPTPPNHDDSSDAASVNAKRDSFAGTDKDDMYSRLGSRNLSRANSIYSISRVSFTNQITQLTSIQLPDANALSSSISAIQTAPKAARALSDAADKIQAWINKASGILDGLDARDDIDWAAQAGKDGLSEVNGAITRFDSLVNVYIDAVEKLEMREDAGDIPGDELQEGLRELEKIVGEWQKIKNSMSRIKRQVELALDWEELRNSLFDEISQECQKLSREIFEMEERRHMAGSERPVEPTAAVDLDELETMVDNKAGSPASRKPSTHRYNSAKQPLPQGRTSPLLSPGLANTDEDTDLLGLFARMQPLRANLDFLPMKITGFQKKAKHDFPTACSELEEGRDHMEEQWRKLKSDAESLQRELGEDQWVIVFRNAGKQALNMVDSVNRSIKKLDEALDPNTQLRHAPATVKKLENYEAKKLHYCPSIERVIAIVDRGVKDRLTVNGEIVRLQNDVQNRWQATQMDIRNLDDTLNYYHAAEAQELRESVSSAISNDQSFLSSHMESLGGSPLSSVGPSSRSVSRTRPPKDVVHTSAGSVTRPRQVSVSSNTDSKPVTPASKRFSSLPVPVTPASARHASQQSTPPSRLTVSSATRSSPASNAASPRTPLSARPASRLSSTPFSATLPARPTSRLSQTPGNSAPASSKPRWNYSHNTSSIGHNFKPLAVTEPSPYRKVVTPVKYTPPGASRRQSSLTPASNIHSRRTSANYSAGSSVVGSPSPSLQPGSSAKLRRPSSLLLNQSPLDSASAEAGAEEVVEVESPTSTATQPGTRPGSSLAARTAVKSGPYAQQKPRMTSAGALRTSANANTQGTPPRQPLHKKRSDIGLAGRR